MKTKNGILFFITIILLASVIFFAFLIKSNTYKEDTQIKNQVITLIESDNSKNSSESSYYNRLLGQGVPNKEIAIIGSELESKGYKKEIFNMSEAEKDCNPCTGECESRSSGQIFGIYDSLKTRMINSAYVMVNDFPLGAIFPICSSAHSIISSVPSQNGIILFIESGSGYPSEDSTGYSLGFLSADENEIILYEKYLDGEFFGNRYVDYNNLLEQGDYNSAVGILNGLEMDMSVSMMTGIFENKYLQKEYMDIVNSL